MKRKSKISLLLSLMATASLFIFTGCKLGITKQEILDRYDLTARITYYVNGDKATFEPIAATERDIYYKTGQTPYVIPESKITYQNHIFDGWYEVECDKNGEPIPVETFKDKNGNVTHSTYTLTQEADFSPLEEGEHRYYAAKWLTRTKVRVQLVLDDTAAKVEIDQSKLKGEYFAPIQDKETVGHGDEIMAFSYDGSTGSLPSFSAKLPIKDNAYTFIAYYADEACTQSVAWPIKEQEEDVYIYAKYITGKWTVVNSISGVTQMFNQMDSAKARFYLASDIDCTALAGSISPATKLACEIQGNGFALKNLKIVRNNLDSEMEKTSIFGEITSTAVLNNLRFENLTFECKFQQGADMENYYYLFTSLDKDAKISNVKVSGSMLMYSHENVLLPNLREEPRKNFLFGGYETDETYLTQTNGEGFSLIQPITVELDLKSYA